MVTVITVVLSMFVGLIIGILSAGASLGVNAGLASKKAMAAASHKLRTSFGAEGLTDREIELFAEAIQVYNRTFGEELKVSEEKE